MSKKSENKSSESTLFSPPPSHNDKPSKRPKKAILTLIASFVALLFVAAALYAGLKLLPDKSVGSSSDYKTVISCKATDLKTITYKTEADEFTLRRAELEGYNEEGYAFLIEGIEEYKQDIDTANLLAETLCGLKGVKMEAASDSVYGFDKPTVSLTLKGEGIDYAVTVGNAAGSERYVKITGDKSGIYRIDSASVQALIKEKLDFATKSAYSIASFTTDVSAYKDSAGALTSFDRLSVKNSLNSYDYEFVMNTNEITAEYSPYLISGDIYRYSQNAERPLSIFTDTLNISGAYSYFDDAQSLSDFGLDEPDIKVSLKVGNEEKWFLFKSVDEEYCAVLSDDRHFISKVKKTDISFWSLEKNDYFYNELLPFGAENIASISIIGEGISGDYTVSEDKEKTAEAEQLLSAVKSLIQSAEKAENGYNYDLALIFTLTDGSTNKIYFIRNGSSKYTVKSNGVSGEISNTAYNNILKIVKQI